MPKICYTPKDFNAAANGLIGHANTIIGQYALQGYDLTLRQLYYQFVSRDLFPASWADAATGSTNNERSYKKLGDIISQARRAGRIDWDRIVDRTRNVRTPPHWDGPAEIVEACARSFAVDWWAEQPVRVEVWVEKDALLGVLEVACAQWHCPYFSCRGYTSDSEVWGAAQRFSRHGKNDQKTVVIHLGDHDPSGIDMSRDIKDRLNLFADVGTYIDVRRVALNMDQVEEHNPPPNPAKVTDSRYRDYEENYGDESWELDALSPEIITGLIASEMESLIDADAWADAEKRQAEGRQTLSDIARDWNAVSKFMKK